MTLHPGAGDRLRVLAIVREGPTARVLPRVLPSDDVVIAADLSEGMARVHERAPDVAFIDVMLEGGAGLALVHHITAVSPGVTIFALATAEGLEAAAHAVALGGASVLMLPLGGDEVLSAVAQVRARRQERATMARLEDAAHESARAAGWIARAAELADAPDRTTAAQWLTDLVREATGGDACAVYLTVADAPAQRVRFAASPALATAPVSATEAQIAAYAREHQLMVVPLATRSVRAGHVLIQPVHAGPRVDGLVKVLATQAATALALFMERERTGGGATIKDPTSSAYSFAYYVDVAGREIDKARRHGRRFAIATVGIDPHAPASGVYMSPAELADQLLKAVRDTDVLARVDEHEFHLLMPETDGLGAHACRRRLLGRVAGFAERRGAPIGAGLVVGVATFPHDGHDLSLLLRKARRRAEESKTSVARRVRADTGLGQLLETLEPAAVASDAFAPAATARRFEIPIAAATALAGAVANDALRGGASFFAVAHHANLSLGAAVRAAVGQGRDNVVLHALDLRSNAACEDVEALAAIAEHGAYALLARSRSGVLRGVHAADPWLADVIAERLGRAAGLRVFA